MSYSDENPENPEVDLGELDDKREARAEQASANLRSRLIPPHTLKDSGGELVHGDAMTEAEVARLVGVPQPSLSRYRKKGIVNPKLLLADSSPVARPAGTPGVIVWYRRSLVEQIAASQTTEPFYVRPEG